MHNIRIFGSVLFGRKEISGFGDIILWRGSSCVVGVWISLAFLIRVVYVIIALYKINCGYNYNIIV